MRKRELISEAISYALVILFAYAAVSKALDYELFVEQIGQSNVLAGMAKFIALVIPALELATCFFLLVPRFRPAGLIASVLLMLVFTIYIALIMTLSSKVPCSCGGILSKMGWQSHLVFNIVFTILSVVGLWTEYQGSRMNLTRV